MTTRGRAARSASTILALVAVASAAGCGGSHGPRAESHGAIGGDVVARVGSEPIAAPLVAQVARAKHVSPRDALTSLVEDALFANEARARGLDRRVDVARDLDASDAHLVMLRLRERANGPPTDAEVEELTRVHWSEVDSPEQLVVIHAVALRPKKATADLAPVRATAEAIAAAVHDATSAEDFETKANAVPHPGVDVRVEKLPPFVADGRVAGEDTSLDATFCKAADAIPAPGTNSPLVETSFGWHVIRLIQRIPANHVAFETRRAAFAEEARARRSRRAYEELTTSLHKATRVEIADDAETLMAGVTYGAPSRPRP